MSHSPDDDHPGIPTRAIHDAYLDMQRALKQYRKATDAGAEHAIRRAHGELQETVLTFYELLRPHLKRNDAVRDWWDGELPGYPQADGQAPDPEDGKGVLQVQTHQRTVALDGENLEDLADAETLEEWHDHLGLNGNVRLASVYADDSDDGPYALLQVQRYQLGLRQLDGWETGYVRTTTAGDGFLSEVEETTTERQRVAITRLKRAARELADVAEKLTLLSDVDASETRTEITRELIDEVNEWRERKNLND